MNVTSAQLAQIAGGRPDKSNINSIVVALTEYGPKTGLDKPHRLAQFIAQIAHESGGLKYDREIWGPTAAQRGYEGRKDLGNTVKGDGKKFAGRGPIQLTGRGNVTRFHKWCVAEGLDPPDFIKTPDLINTDPWEGLSAIWYWHVGNPTGKSLNVFADKNDIEMITRRVNGGLNGFDDRLRLYTRAGLVLEGYAPTAVREFQTAAQKAGFLPKGKDQLDGIAGPKTRAALHMAMANGNAVAAAPVTQQVDIQSPGKGVADAATGAGIGAAGVGGALQSLQEQLTPFSSAGGWIGRLVVILIIVGALLTVGGLAWRWWANRRKKQMVAALNAPEVEVEV